MILFALLLLFNVRAVTTVALRALVDLALHSRTEGVLWPVLFLTGEDALIEEFCVLPGVESIVAHVLTVVRSRCAALSSGLALLTSTWPAGCYSAVAATQ